MGAHASTIPHQYTVACVRIWRTSIIYKSDAKQNYTGMHVIKKEK